jgi:hypothetical protein
MNSTWIPTLLCLVTSSLSSVQLVTRTFDFCKPGRPADSGQSGRSSTWLIRVGEKWESEGHETRMTNPARIGLGHLRPASAGGLPRSAQA